MKNPDKGANHWRMINPLGGSLPTVNHIFPPMGKYEKTELIFRRIKFWLFCKR